MELAMQNGLESVTTDEIAVAAGVSTRTFFNYFPNKEAAAVGHPPSIGTDDKEALRKGTGPLEADLNRVLNRHINVLEKDEDLLRMVGKILRSNEKARGILDGYLAAEREELTEVLFGRVGNRQTSAALASIVTSTIGRAIFLWEHQQDMTLNATLDVVWRAQIDASRLLLPSTNEDART